MSGSGSGGSRVSIPSGVRKTLQSIREITGKQHSDEDIYSVLRECSFDPNETAQKLLYLDTFHEVRRRRDRRRENPMPGTSVRGARSGRGNYSSNYISSDSGGRNTTSKRENGVNHIMERSSMPSLRAPGKAKTETVPHVTKAPSVVSNEPSALSNGSSTHEHCAQSSLGGIQEDKVSSTADMNKSVTPQMQVSVAEQPSSAPTPTFCSVVRVEQEKSIPNSSDLAAPVRSRSSSGVYSSASDPVLPPSVYSNPGAVGTITRETGSQWKVTEPNHLKGKKDDSHHFDSGVPKSEKESHGASTTVHRQRALSKSKAVEKNQQSESLSSSSSTQDGSLVLHSNHDSKSLKEVVAATVKANAPLLTESDVADGPHVTFPLHFQVAQALKNGLTFGSFDSNFGIGTNGTSNDKSKCVVESSHGSDGTADVTSPSNQTMPSTVEGENINNSQSTPPVGERVLQSDGDMKADELKQEVLFNLESHQRSSAQNVPSYSFGFMSPVAGNQFLQFEAIDTQIGNSAASHSSNPTPAVQNSVAPSQHPVHLFRQPYPPNCFPYGHYLSPIFMPPIHQFLSPNGLPQQPATANIYLPPGAAAPGVKFAVPQFKPGTNAGNPTHIGLPSGYGSYGPSPVGFNHVPAVTSGNSASNEDLAASQLKENIYTTGPLNDGSAVWMPAPGPAPGQDLSSLQVNSLYNLCLQGQHPLFSAAQTGHGAFGGIYQSAQAMAAPSNTNPLLQQSQAMSAAVEAAGPPSAAYQQAQLAQMNWNTNY